MVLAQAGGISTRGAPRTSPQASRIPLRCSPRSFSNSTVWISGSAGARPVTRCRVRPAAIRAPAPTTRQRRRAVSRRPAGRIESRRSTGTSGPLRAADVETPMRRQPGRSAAGPWWRTAAKSPSPARAPSRKDTRKAPFRCSACSSRTRRRRPSSETSSTAASMGAPSPALQDDAGRVARVAARRAARPVASLRVEDHARAERRAATSRGRLLLEPSDGEEVAPAVQRQVQEDLGGLLGVEVLRAEQQALPSISSICARCRSSPRFKRLSTVTCIALGAKQEIANLGIPVDGLGMEPAQALVRNRIRTRQHSRPLRGRNDPDPANSIRTGERLQADSHLQTRSSRAAEAVFDSSHRRMCSGTERVRRNGRDGRRSLRRTRGGCSMPRPRQGFSPSARAVRSS